jgi:hypothetical protein
MKGVVESGLLWVLLILIAIFLLAVGIPIVLRAIGLGEWGNLIDNLQNLQKHKGEGVTISLPQYVGSIMFFRGEGGECKHPLCKDICLDRNGKPCQGNTFITVNIESGAKPTTLSVLWNAATLRIDKAKAEAVKMAVADTCLPKDYEINIMTPKFVTDNVLVLQGDRSGTKTYCITPEEISGKINLNIKEGAC